jgi:hypothetical protein
MKKFLFVALFAMIGTIATAQEIKDKVKKTSTMGQKIHNTVSKHKHYKGYKTKHKHNGVTNKHKVDLKTGEIKNKTT